MIVNLNDKVRVKLTDRGYVSYVLEHKRKPELDADGYLVAQLWVLMADFGPHLYMGGLQLFENNNLEILP